MTIVHAWAAPSAGAPFEPFTYELGALEADEIDIAVTHCGICHSDLSMQKNEWGMSRFPLVPGHEVVGTVAAVGASFTHLKAGQRVGLGWMSRSCMTCNPCMGGDQNLCPTGEGTIVGRHGGFADRVRAQAAWAMPLPDEMDSVGAGPLFCGGATVFTPFLEFDVRPTDRVGIIGIGGLGHMALMFARAWGCEVWAFTTSDSKAEEAKKLGAHEVANTRDADRLATLAGQFDLVLNTTNAPLPFDAYMQALAPKGRFVTVGALVEKPVELGAFSLIAGQKTLAGSQIGSILTIRKMLEFCARHNISPQIETFPMNEVNEAMAHLEAGKARYRVVLEA